MNIKGVISTGKEIYSGFKANRKSYKQYSRIVKDWQRKINQTSCTTIDICKVSKSITSKNGFSKETLETLQTTEFIDKFHAFLAAKGYETPKWIAFAEHMLPRYSGLAGQSMGKGILYNPRCINTLDFRIPIHETGHYSRHLPAFPFKMGCDNYLFDFGQLLKKIPFIKNLYKTHILCHLSKAEQLALKADYARAYKEGYFKHNPFHVLSKERVAQVKDPQKAKKLNRELNQMAKDFRKRPEVYYLPNSQLNREEFIADYFNLAAQGFEFSPIIQAKYVKYKGPKIGKVITKDELENLAKLRKEISSKTLQDYGYSWNM